MSDGRSLSYLKPGQTLGKYVVKQLLGRGGMAEVYRALNPDLNQDVAIKVLHPHVTESAGSVARFRREAQSIARLNHPNIMRVFDFDASDGLNYMVMEVIDGPTLREVLTGYPTGMPEPLARTLFEKILEAVAFAHANGVVHRDIKPANVLIASGNRPILTDFGLATVAGGEKLTQTGTGVGTPSYMSPEQISGGTIGAQSDVYSLGILFFEMLSGRVPFEADSYPILITKHLYELPPPLREFVPDVSPAFNAVVVQALSKDAEHRFRDAGAMLAAFRGDTPGSLPTSVVIQPDMGTVNLHTITPVPGTSGYSQTILPQPTPTESQSVRLSQTIQTIQKNPILASGALIAGALVVIGLLIVAAIQAANAPGGTGNSTPSTTTNPQAPAGMVYIPGGKFTMGTANGDEIEKPPHAVTLRPFFMDKTEVTNRDYLAFVLDTRRPQPKSWPSIDRGSWVIEATTGYVVGSPSNEHAYDGVERTPITGKFRIDVNPDTDKGTITGEFTAAIVIRKGQAAQSGTWTFTHDVFQGRKPFYQGGVGENISMHGDSGNEGPIFPTMNGIVATWGAGKISLDGTLLVPELNFHVMYTDGLRDGQLRILKSADLCCYSPQEPGKGFVGSPKMQLVILMSTGEIYSADDLSKGQPPIRLELYLENPTVLRQPSGGAVQFPPGTADHPVTGVTWDDAVAYCEANKRRLPNEAEWEFAARGTNNRLYPWGDTAKLGSDIPANWAEGKTVKVGSYPAGASPFGLLDMAGNAWEWVHDWYDPDYYQSNSGADNPVGMPFGDARILRGGGYTQRDQTGSQEFRTTFRLPRDPATTDPTFGFRCAKDVQ